MDEDLKKIQASLIKITENRAKDAKAEDEKEIDSNDKEAKARRMRLALNKSDKYTEEERRLKKQQQDLLEKI